MKLEREGQTLVFRILNLETVNRCNGKCAFCPANVRDEKRLSRTDAKNIHFARSVTFRVRDSGRRS